MVITNEQANKTGGCVAGFFVGGLIGLALFGANQLGVSLPYIPLEFQKSFETSLVPIGIAFFGAFFIVKSVLSFFDKGFK